MTATLKGERIDRREGSRTANGPRTYRRVWVVETDDPDDGVDIVLGVGDLPQEGDPYVTDNENDLQALVNERTAIQLPKVDCVWEATISYTTTTDEQDDDPLLRPVNVTWGFETFQVIAKGVDDNGKEVPLVMSNGEPFDPPPTIEHSRPILTVSRNEQTINPAFFANFQNATNESDWLDAVERTVKVKGITAVKQTDAKDSDNKYWRVTYVFVYESDTWDIKGLNQGTYFLDISDLDGDGNPKKKAFLTEEGQPRLGFLNNQGDEGDPDEPTFSETLAFKQRDFSELKLEAAILDQLDNRVNR